MPELDDVQIDRPQRGPEDRERPKRRSSVVVWVVVVLLLIGVGAALYYFLGVRRMLEAPAEGSNAQAESVAPPAETTAESPPGAPDLPPLSASDEAVRRLVRGLSERPALASWVATTGWCAGSWWSPTTWRSACCPASSSRSRWCRRARSRSPRRRTGR